MAKMGTLFLQGLIGDSIQAHMAWGRNVGVTLVAAVAEGGKCPHHKALCAMSPWIQNSLFIPYQEDTQLMVDKALKALLDSGVTHLKLWDSEDIQTYVMRSNNFPKFDSFQHLALVEPGFSAGLVKPWEIPDEAKKWKIEFLKEHGVTRYVVVHNREPGYASKLFKSGVQRANSWANDVRNFKIEPLIQACEEALPKNVRVIRVGDPSMEPINHPKVIDVSGLALSLEQQFAIHKDAWFFIGCNTGVANIAHGLHKPLALINTTQPLTTIRFKDVPSINLAKQIFLEGKQAGYAEIDLFHGGQGPGRLLDGLGYEVKENSFGEIVSVIQKMIQLLEAQATDDLYLDRGKWLSESEMADQLLGMFLKPKDERLVPLLMQRQKENSRFKPRDIRQTPNGPFRLGFLGMGEMGIKELHFFKRLKPHWKFDLYDNDKKKWGQSISGLKIRDPKQMKRGSLDLLIICTNSDRGSIAKELSKKGWADGRDFIYFDRIRDPSLGFVVEAHKLGPTKIPDSS